MVVFPSWIPGENEAVCAKFDFYYEPLCFKNHSAPIIHKTVRDKKSKNARRLQRRTARFFCYFQTVLITGACEALMRTLGDCLRFFNEMCSDDRLQTGVGDFTLASTGTYIITNSMSVSSTLGSYYCQQEGCQ